MCWSRAPAAAAPATLRKRNVEVDARRLARSHANLAHDRLDAFMPSHESVLPFGNVVDRVVTPLVRQREKRVRQHEHDRAHILMNVTEDLYGSCAMEGPRPRLAFGESSEVEPSRAGGARQRVDVVKDVVVVGELDCTAARDGRHVWNE